MSRPTPERDRQMIAAAVLDNLRDHLIDAMPREWSTYAVRQHLADALLPVVRAYAAEQLRETADAIDRGPTFPMQPSIISALVRERADDLEAGR